MFRTAAASASRAIVLVGLLAGPAVSFSGTPQMSAAEIVKKSVAVNDADWGQQPVYSNQEREVNAKVNADGKVSSKQEKTFRVHMINGSPYNELLAVNDQPLSAAQKQQEEAKLKAETKRRARESSGARANRVGKYKKDRAQEHLLMHEMISAFNFKLVGEANVNGHECYVLDAIPNPGYKPGMEKARVLTGMKGRLWIDKENFHWVRVHAQVVKPVDFGFFIAKVRPGTEFELDQTPINGTVWMPSHFSQSVNARVLGVYGIRNREDDYFSDYAPVGSRSKAEAGAETASR